MNVYIEKKQLYNWVLFLAIFTIVYNFAEGLISTFLGYEDESLTLFGFGADSFIEVISGIGILQMVIRIKNNPTSSKNKSEITALRITGFGFYILGIGLIVSSILNIYQGHKPVTTFWGVIISLISITVMFWLYKSKIHIGKKLNSEPIIADAKCTLVCIYMSIVLLLSRLIYQLKGLGWLYTLGAVGLAWFSYTEGKEAFSIAKGKKCNCCI